MDSDGAIVQLLEAAQQAQFDGPKRRRHTHTHTHAEPLYSARENNAKSIALSSAPSLPTELDGRCAEARQRHSQDGGRYINGTDTEPLKAGKTRGAGEGPPSRSGGGADVAPGRTAVIFGADDGRNNE